MTTELRRLRAENEALLVDAGRYRYLLDRALSSHSGEKTPVLICAFDLPLSGWRDEICRRIDCAMQSNTEEG
jgi:hypothetical protein